MNRLKKLIEQLNSELYNPVGLNILWPRNVAFLFVSGPPIYPFQSESHFYIAPLIQLNVASSTFLLDSTGFFQISIIDWRSWKLSTMSVLVLRRAAQVLTIWVCLTVKCDQDRRRLEA